MVTLVLLPGLDGTGRLFAPFVAALADEFAVRLVRYPTDGALGYAELESIARASLPSKGPFVIVAESFSGPIGVSLAAASPPGLLGLVLCVTFVKSPYPALSALAPFTDSLPVSRLPLPVLSWWLLGSDATPPRRAAVAEVAAIVSPTAFLARLKAVLTVDVSRELGEIRVPLLDLRASNDRLVPASAGRLVAELCPNGKLVVLKGPHCLLLAAPEESAKAIASFLREIQFA